MTTGRTERYDLLPSRRLRRDPTMAQLGSLGLATRDIGRRMMSGSALISGNRDPLYFVLVLVAGRWEVKYKARYKYYCTYLSLVLFRLRCLQCIIHHTSFAGTSCEGSWRAAGNVFERAKMVSTNSPILHKIDRKLFSGRERAAEHDNNRLAK